MNYLEPTNIAEALAALDADKDARCLAGGQTLVAMMNAELVEPTTLIGLRRIIELIGVTEDAAAIRIGALTTHASVASEDKLAGSLAVVRDAARQIAHPAIRNVGTIGGSICHGDPQADLPGALVSANASVEVMGASGQRTISIDDFFQDYFETSLAQGEILTTVVLPKGPPGAASMHLKFSRVEGDYATVSISLVLKMDGDVCSYARAAVGSVGPVPLHLDEVDAILTGSKLNDQDIDKAGNRLAAAANPLDDVRGSSEYRRLLISGLLSRAVGVLREQLNG